jgi:hypothetical protein
MNQIVTTDYWIYSICRNKYMKTNAQVVMVVHACNPSYMGSRGRRTEVQAWPCAKARPYLKNN